MTNSLQRQVGGGHYKGMGIQPVEFGYVNRYDPAAFSTLKYISRHAVKNGREDLLKGRHFIELRYDLRQKHVGGIPQRAINAISMQDYIESNKLPVEEGSLLMDLHWWATGRSHLSDKTTVGHILQKFDHLIDIRYPQEKE